jgi:catechol 2,3-dioxygenase-like lactoylglutathione lyase family enzyme
MKKTIIGRPVPQLPVKDVEKTQAYYQNTLGFDILWTEPDKSIGAVGREGCPIFFARTDKPFEPNIHWIFAEDVDATFAEFKGRGAAIVEDIENKPWNMRQFTIRDLNGHIFHIHHDL